MSSNSETPNYSQYDNCLVIQTFANGALVTTAGFINMNANPPLLSDVSPVEAPTLLGRQTSMVVNYKGQIVTNFIIQGNDSIEIG